VVPALNPVIASEPFGIAVVVPSARYIATLDHDQVIAVGVDAYVNAAFHVGGMLPLAKTPDLDWSISFEVRASLETRAKSAPSVIAESSESLLVVPMAFTPVRRRLSDS
jgi:hypothetical protein